MWQDTGNEYVHTKVMKKLHEVLCSDEEYAFLDDSAKKRLNQIRTVCRNAAMANADISDSENRLAGGSIAFSGGRALKITPTLYAVFPFLGTRACAALMYELRRRGFGANVWLHRYIPVCIEVKTDRSLEELESALAEIKRDGADKYSFNIPDNCEISGKYNDYIPRELLKKQYVEDYLDAADMKENL